MSAPSGERPASPSQRPTVEMQEDDSLEFDTLPPVIGSSLPPESAARATVPGPAIPSWSTFEKGGALPPEFELRLIHGMLRALVPIHTNLHVPPKERVHGRVCYRNTIIEADGTVRLWNKDDALDAPGNLQAPEVIAGGAPDQQADLYAVGVLLMEFVRRGDEADAMVERMRAVAQRALRLDPDARWASATEFADAIEVIAGLWLPPPVAFAAFLKGQSVCADTLVRPVPSSVPQPPPPSRRTPRLDLDLEVDASPDDPVDRQALPIPLDGTTRGR